MFEVSLPLDLVASLRGVMLDLDPGLYRPELFPDGPPDGEALYRNLAGPWLAHDPVLRNAEVRDTGRGLHAILWIDPPIELTSETERTWWAAAVPIVQRVLPTDPDCPGLTALTRPVGSTNGKTGRPVRVLTPGRPVAAEEVEGLVYRMLDAPFRTVAAALFGSGPVAPCPACRRDGSHLDPLDRVGRCYGSCGRVTVADLFDRFLQARPAKEGG